jgi:ATP-binding cassette subfamily C protein LapB
VENLPPNLPKPDIPRPNIKPDYVDTLLECLMLLCQINGTTMTRDALISGLPLRDGKLTPALFKRASERANLVSKIIKKPFDKLPIEFFPAILLLKNEEAC